MHSDIVHIPFFYSALGSSSRSFFTVLLALVHVLFLRCSWLQFTFFFYSAFVSSSCSVFTVLLALVHVLFLQCFWFKFMFFFYSALESSSCSFLQYSWVQFMIFLQCSWLQFLFFFIHCARYFIACVPLFLTVCSALSSSCPF